MNRKTPFLLLLLSESILMLLFAACGSSGEVPQQQCTGLVNNCTINNGNTAQTVPTFIPTAEVPTPVPIYYPQMASSYTGTVSNTTYGGTAKLQLIAIIQNQQVIGGDVIMGPELCGSGTFAGSIDTTGSLSFLETTNNCGTISFKGVLQNGAISGTYTTASNQEGVWQTTQG
jgi:hypothetical protein